MTVDPRPTVHERGRRDTRPGAPPAQDDAVADRPNVAPRDHGDRVQPCPSECTRHGHPGPPRVAEVIPKALVPVERQSSRGRPSDRPRVATARGHREHRRHGRGQLLDPDSDPTLAVPVPAAHSVVPRAPVCKADEPDVLRRPRRDALDADGTRQSWRSGLLPATRGGGGAGGRFDEEGDHHGGRRGEGCRRRRPAEPGRKGSGPLAHGELRPFYHSSLPGNRFRLLRMTRRRRTVLIAALASAGAVAVAVPALTARGGGGDPPTVSGPLALNDQRCFQKGDRFGCAFDYLLYLSTTHDPRRRTGMGYGRRGNRRRPPGTGFARPRSSSGLPGRARRSQRERFLRSARARPGLASGRASWLTRPATRGRLPSWSSLDRAGRARHDDGRWRPADGALAGRDDPRDVAGLRRRGPSIRPARRTTSAATSTSSASRARNAGPPGPGFRARISPAVSSRGHTAYVQVRIPGTHIQPGPNIKPGFATIAIGSGLSDDSRSGREGGAGAAGPSLRPLRGPLRRAGHAARTERHPAVPAAAARPLVGVDGPGRSRTSARGFEVRRSSAELRGRGRRVADGTRTRDHRDHNPGLYQLSYRHHAAGTG